MQVVNGVQLLNITYQLFLSFAIAAAPASSPKTVVVCPSQVCMHQCNHTNLLRHYVKFKLTTSVTHSIRLIIPTQFFVPHLDV